MKKILKPSEKEEAEYRSDFSDKSFIRFDPDVEIKFEFNYGSKFDGANLELHLTDEESKVILDFIRSKLSQEKKKDLRDELKYANQDLVRYLLNEKN